MLCFTFSEKKITSHLKENHSCFRLLWGSPYKEIESTQNTVLYKIIGMGHIKTWRHKSIFLAVVIKANFHQGNLKWLQQALRGLPSAVASDQCRGHMSHTWGAESDTTARAQLLRGLSKGTTAQGASHGGKHNWDGTWGSRPQQCLPEMPINAWGALLSLLIITGSSTGTVKCLHWTSFSEARKRWINYLLKCWCLHGDIGFPYNLGFQSNLL